MPIEDISFEHLSALSNADINLTTSPRQRNAFFTLFNLMIANKMLPLILHTSRV